MTYTMIDDRTAAEAETQTVMVLGLDKFMSGWGGAAGGNSYAAWACTREQASYVLDWVERRGDITRARIVNAPKLGNGPRMSASAAHVHIYATSDTHPALRDWVRHFGSAAA